MLASHVPSFGLQKRKYLRKSTVDGEFDWRTRTATILTWTLGMMNKHTVHAVCLKSNNQTVGSFPEK
jgi:hypothetical protein